MPKLPKHKRARKYQPPRSKATLAKIYQALRSMYFYDGDALSSPVITPYDPAKMRINAWFDVNPDDVLHALRAKKMFWQFRYLAFCVDETGLRYIKQDYLDLSESGVKMSVNDMHREGLTDMRPFRAKQNANHLVSIAHVATPSKDVDMDDLVDKVIPLIEAQGAYDKLTCELTIQERIKNPQDVHYGDERGRYA